MAKLREKQKSSRREKIISAARELFMERGYADVPVEAIAEVAEVSAVTIFKYFGTKGGLLLAVVAESDRIMLEKIENMMRKPPKGAHKVLSTFFKVVMDHSFTYLDREIWRQTLAISILEGESGFGRGYINLEENIISLLTGFLDHLKETNELNLDMDSAAFAEVIYNAFNGRLVQFVRDRSLSRKNFDSLMDRDLTVVLNTLSTNNR